jgi:hypothetical protein
MPAEMSVVRGTDAAVIMRLVFTDDDLFLVKNGTLLVNSYKEQNQAIMALHELTDENEKNSLTFRVHDMYPMKIGVAHHMINSQYYGQVESCAQAVRKCIKHAAPHNFEAIDRVLKAFHTHVLSLTDVYSLPEKVTKTSIIQGMSQFNKEYRSVQNQFEAVL